MRAKKSGSSGVSDLNRKKRRLLRISERERGDAYVLICEYPIN
jgi:hypothetical protein